jgi:hypothetical protein
MSKLQRKEYYRKTGENKMNHLMKVMMGIMIIAANCSAQLIYQPIPSKSRAPGKYEFDHIEIVGLAGSLNDLIMMSDLIIDGTVDKALPSVRIGANDPLSLETYCQISVNKVIRGDLPKGQQIVGMAEPGGNSQGYEVIYKEYPLVKPNERYILFLKPYFGRNVKMVNDLKLGMPLYMPVGNGASYIKVNDKGLVQLLPVALPTLTSFDGLKIETFTTALTERINKIYPTVPSPDRLTDPSALPAGVPLPPFGYKKP